MRYKKILLINPPYNGARIKAVFCAGLGYIAESLKAADFEYDIFDMSLGYDYRDLRRKITAFGPDLIGISMMTYRYKDTYKLAENIAKDYPSVDILAGGPHVSLFREKVLTDCSAIDYGAVMEGEETIVELCKGDPAESIKGLIFRKKDAVIYGGGRPFIKDLDRIPFPRYEKFELGKVINKTINALPIVTSRGCPFECIYCPVKCSIGQIFRARSPENILKELIYWYEKGYRRFSFADDNFTLTKKRVYDLCELIKKEGLKDLRMSCDNGVRADSMDKDLLGIMKDVGFYRIAFGVEAGNNRILNNLKKREDIETVKAVIQEAIDLDYEVDLFFLVGSPGETWGDIEDSFKIALGYQIGTAFFYNIVPFPNTELFEWIKENGRFLKEPEEYLNYYPILDNDPVFETTQMPFKARKKALKHAFKIMRKTMRRAWRKRLSNMGIFGKVIAFIYASRFMQDVVIRIGCFRKVIYKITDFFFL